MWCNQTVIHVQFNIQGCFFSGLPDLFCDADVGSCLLYVLTPMTFAAARAHCQSLGMDLAAMETHQELDFANSIRNKMTGWVIFIRNV